MLYIKVSRKKKVCSRFKVIVLLYIAHFFKKEVTGSPSEVCKLEIKKKSPKFASRVRKIKKNSLSQWIGNKGIFHMASGRSLMYSRKIVGPRMEL